MYPAPTSAEIHPSLKGWWRVLEIFPHRYYNTDGDAKEVLRIPWGAWRTVPDGAMLHRSVIEKAGEGYKYASPNLKCGSRTEIAEGPWAGYGRFAAPKPKRGWRQNLLVLFGVKTVLTAVPVLVLWPVLLWVIELIERAWRAGARDLPQWMQRVVGEIAGALDAGWVRSLREVLMGWAAASGQALWVVERSLMVAAAIVLFWTVVRLVKPRG
jgi:hypothetical protein